jgi:hypothetical protein
LSFQFQFRSSKSILLFSLCFPSFLLCHRLEAIFSSPPFLLPLFHPFPLPTYVSQTSNGIKRSGECRQVLQYCCYGS